MEYGLAGDLRVADADQLLRVVQVVSDGQEFIGLQFRRRVGVSDLIYRIESSRNLIDWSVAAGGGARGEQGQRRRLGHRDLSPARRPEHEAGSLPALACDSEVIGAARRTGERVFCGKPVTCLGSLKYNARDPP